MSKPLFLVTGAAGFVGQNLVKLLTAEKLPVRAMVRTEADARRVEAFGAESIIADLTMPDSLTRAVQGVTGVFHIAALFRQAGLPESEFIKVNSLGTRLLLEACVTEGVHRFIHCSTIGVHGHIDHPPADESTPYCPGDMYQRSKVDGEKIALSFFNEGKIAGGVIRPAMIYGPDDQRTLKLFQMIAKKRFFYVGSGEATVDFVDVRDLCRAFLLLMQNTSSHGEVFIISGGHPMSLTEMVSRITFLLNVSKPWIHLPVKPLQLLGSLCELVCTPLGITPPLYRRRVDFFTKHRHFTSAKAKEKLGYKSAQTFDQELVDIINSYKLSGSISGGLLTKPGTLRRSLDGSILHWDSEAEKLYGWADHQVRGDSSHTLLNTKFPSSLDIINRELTAHRKWLGKLVHSDKNGKRVEVISRWELQGPGDEVLETNFELHRSIDTKFSEFYIPVAIGSISASGFL